MSSISTLSSCELVLEFFLCVFHRDSNLTYASRNRILVHLALALPLELIHTLGWKLFLMFCQGVFKLLALLLISHTVTCLLLKIVVKSSNLRPLLCRFHSTSRVPILRLVPGDGFVQFPFLRAVFSSTICDVTSSSVHCSANFPSLLALALVIFLTCC